MTKEDVIDFCEMKAESEPENEDIFNYIIEALDRETYEDCVSRKAIEKLKRWRFSYNNNTTIPKSDLFVKLTDLRDLSSVTPVACIATVTLSKDDLQELVDGKVKELCMQRRREDE